MKRPKDEYMKNKVLTAPKEELLLMLFDGAIRFSQQGRAKLEAGDLEDSRNSLIRAQRIMIELVTSLDKNTLPDEIYTNLVRLYNFVYFRLIDANLKKDVSKVDEALQILANLRGTWAEAIELDRNRKFPESTSLDKARRARSQG